MTAMLGKNKKGQRGVFIQTDRISELDFLCDLVREVNKQRELQITTDEKLKFFSEVSTLVAEGFTQEDPEFVDWAVESAAGALRIATEA